MTFLIILMILMVIVTITIVSLLISRKNKAKLAILNELNLYGPTTKEKDKIYDYLVDTKDFVYCIKVIYNFNNLEISVNNKNYWQLNDKVISSKKSGTKLEGIYDLVNDEKLKFDKPHKKVYLVYPNSKILVRAVNESELAFIHPNTDCFGVNLIKFTELDDLFKK